MARNRFSAVMSLLVCLAIPSVAAANVTFGAIPASLKSAVSKARNLDNCVLFLRNDLGIRLPNVDLSLWTTKKASVNITGTPRYGDVAIIATPGKYAAYGHVALVIDVTGTSITILEAHYAGNTATVRKATGKNLADAEGQLNIYGFYRPR